MAEQERLGYQVVGTIKAIKGYCSAGHNVGDQIELSSHSSGGLCGFFYHDLFPYIVMLQFGGSFPPDWGDPDVLELDCMDKYNLATIELKRVRE
ncbi:MAG: TIGR04076 family protein [Chloroflexota bacterium]|nr:TIGR04076 family protein [Chloroflexota bacterium]